MYFRKITRIFITDLKDYTNYTNFYHGFKGLHEFHRFNLSLRATAWQSLISYARNFGIDCTDFLSQILKGLHKLY